MADFDSDAILREALVLDDDGDHERALELFQALLAQGDTAMYLNVGNTLESLGRLHEAREAYSDGFASGDADSGYNLAVSLSDAGRDTEARSVLDELIEQSYPAAQILLAWMLDDDGDRASAARLIRSACEDQTEAGNLAAGILGHWMFECGDRSVEVGELLNRGMESYPTARADAASLALERGDESGALALFYAGADAGEAESIVPLANRVWAKGDLTETERLLRHAVDLGDLNATENLSVLLREQNRFAESKQWMRLAHRMRSSA